MNRLRYVLCLALQVPWALASPVVLANGEETLSGITEFASSSGVPALLEYAQQHPQPIDSTLSLQSSEPENKAPTIAAAAAQKRLMNTIKAQQKLLGQQSGEMTQLKAQLAKLSAESAPMREQTTQLKELQHQLATAQVQLADSVHQIASLKLQQAESEKPRLVMQALQLQNDTLMAQVKAAEIKINQAEGLRAQLTALKAQQQTSQQSLSHQAGQLTALNQQLAEGQLQLSEGKKQQDATEAELQLKTQQRDALSQRIQALTKQFEGNQKQLKETSSQLTVVNAQLAAAKLKPDLKTTAAQQAYTAGVSMGHDALKLLLARDAQGLKLDHDIVLSGFRDTFSDTVVLSEDARNKVLQGTAEALNQHMTTIRTKALADGDRYRAEFARRKGVVQDNGVYSLVEYAGMGSINADDIVDVVMKESLPDGTVTVDMETSGRIMSQPLKAYPPVFRQALSKLGNHGAITLVVPPDQAYGDKGIPPRIPPGSTMTYSVRIMDVTPPGQASDAKSTPAEPATKVSK